MKGLSRNHSLPWEFVEKYPKGINGQSWSMRYLAGDSFYDYKATYFSLPLTKPEFKKELEHYYIDMRWRPPGAKGPDDKGGYGYLEAEEHFHSLR